MEKSYKNILLISGSGRNVGKTAFICSVIANLKHLKIIAVKISHHMHRPTPGLLTLASENGWTVSQETNRISTKDSSRYLQAGAFRSFYVQTEKHCLKEAFTALSHWLPEGLPVIIESGGMNEIIKTQCIRIENPSENTETGKTKYKSSVTVFSDGKSFTPQVEIITFDMGWKIRK